MSTDKVTAIKRAQDLREEAIERLKLAVSNETTLYVLKLNKTATKFKIRVFIARKEEDPNDEPFIHEITRAVGLAQGYRFTIDNTAIFSDYPDSVGIGLATTLGLKVGYLKVIVL